MDKILRPNIFLKSVYDLDINVLKSRNIKGIIIDIDNTLVAWETKNADAKVIALIDMIKGHGFNLCILSNATKKRVEEFNKELKLPAIYKALKPRKGSYIKAMNLMSTELSNTAVIGDQIFTDVLGGNRLGLFTILVSPVSPKEFAGTKLVRCIERIVLKGMDRNN